MSAAAELHRLIDELLSDEDRRALSAYRRVADEQLPWLERRAVLLARRRGVSWAAIGRLLGRSRQAVQQRFDRAFTPAELRQPLVFPLTPQEECMRDLDRWRAGRDRRIDAGGDDGSFVAW
jgi:hypothetical protein